ncbi:MAG: hypothetical protein QOJ65_786 [Fimbriimonadaceae bacterium]|jgi:predicted RNase H-like HicB family nuclease|nr:hypothetical protein [Fimbriimonadaceae bacterium]
MLTAYIDAAMGSAVYEPLEDGTWYAQIPGLQGVLGNGNSEEACMMQLQEVLEGWLLLGVALRHEIPAVNAMLFNCSLGNTNVHRDRCRL